MSQFVIDAPVKSVNGKTGDVSVSKTWDRDGSETVTDSDSITYTLNNSYDQVQLHIAVVADNSTEGYLQANGDNSQSYDYLQLDGSQIQGEARWLIHQGAGGGTDTFRVDVSGRWSDACRVGQPQPAPYEKYITQAGWNTGVASPLNSVTFFNDSTNTPTEMKIEVYGRNIA